MVYREQPRPQGQSPASSTFSESSQQGEQDSDGMKERAGQAADQARQKVGDAASSATHMVDERREQASGVMDTAADQIRERGESLPGGERTTEMASMAADKVESTSAYIRDHDVEDMMSDLETLVRKHPTQSLVVAAAAGFLVGRMLRG
jgi:ElaB/YqjD/DUF883 family membrane-anchored ribosome-binding protein